MSLLNRLTRLIPQDFQLKDYPALTVGLIPFTFLLLLLDSFSNRALSNFFSLDPYAPFRFDLNRVSFYVLYHTGFTHYLVNILAIAAPMCHFERAHGTVHTGITLNLLAVTAGLQYCLLGSFLYPNTRVIGLSGIIFSFVTYFAVKEHEFQPVSFRFPLNGTDISLPTKYSPFVSLAIVTVIFPGSSFFGHLAGISSGYLLAYGKLNILYPPSSIIVAIENKLAGLIKLLDGLVDFVGEQEAINLRYVAYSPIFSSDPETVAISSSTDTTAHTTFRSEGHVLGAA
ncbi:hypothetical protein CANTEDRAFT_112606 [Yamadazyma tenuis ATCC 10573]|uniref:Rhomboid-type serine protease 2 n=1 Tax=Candida tenuis (strain ATCC 10573 / BCRC 21748 / CBS 615 / JCM 9827 / NBRC 10315 / NRRL Y-1498 / VKM Y-70) TaxID=590646 RepID=G3AY13_CANTC|nr:uncharacterized protein CANTEDRAFT_112606 [Yamadazyma tenuis ATCC 10573]EGV65746.1 hypothetical protein CANTEDRAFT_112606 [Yamadazyma tenuis ATCC 10573]